MLGFKILYGPFETRRLTWSIWFKIKTSGHLQFIAIIQTAAYMIFINHLMVPKVQGPQ